MGLWQNQRNWAQILVMSFHCRIQQELIVIHLLQNQDYDEDVWLFNILRIEVNRALGSIRLIDNIERENTIKKLKDAANDNK